jgi:hypothetical protein
MNSERLEKIKEEVSFQIDIAEQILEGEREGYDGADGARYIRKLCIICNELIGELERKKEFSATLSD